MLAKAALVALLLGLGSAAEAGFAESIAFHIVPQGADCWSTRYAKRNGAVEGNPLMVTDLEAKKLALTLALAMADNELGKKSKKAQWIMRGGIVIGYGFVVARNVRNGR